MDTAKLRTFSRVRTFSSGAVALAIVLSLLFSSWLGSGSLNWQVVLAVVALAIGIPHGALDHLVTLPKAQPLKMAFFIAIYVAIALAAIWAILQWNIWGFIGVVIMSATHFGIGDSAFISELDRLKGRASLQLPVWAYASAGGALPVAIPLVNSRSTEALEKVNSNLVNWHYGYDAQIQLVVAAIATISLLVLASRKRYRDCVDIALLAALAAIAPYERDDSSAAFRKAVIPGLPALFGTLIFVALLAGFSRDDITDQFLWLTLVTIWALTVPHMIVTAKLDRAALKN
jgi:beta-carotene 15,15'-dioxygenase